MFNSRNTRCAGNCRQPDPATLCRRRRKSRTELYKRAPPRAVPSTPNCNCSRPPIPAQCGSEHARTPTTAAGSRTAVVDEMFPEVKPRLSSKGTHRYSVRQFAAGAWARKYNRARRRARIARCIPVHWSRSARARCWSSIAQTFREPQGSRADRGLRNRQREPDDRVDRVCEDLDL
jgi:hypothetical protein